MPRIGYAAFGWRRSLTEVAREIAALGCHGLEAYGLADPLDEDRDLGTVLEELGLELSASYIAGSFVEPDNAQDERAAFERTASLVKELGGTYVVLGGGRIREDTRDEDWHVFVDALTELGGLAKRIGVQMVFHPHSGTLACTANDIALLAGQTDPAVVNFAFDTAHLVRCGGDPVRLFAEHMSRITYVHLKDYDGTDFVELGKGSVDIPGVYRVLQDAGYEGWLTVELDAPDDPRASAEANLQYLREVLQIDF